jgi:hypothetical protein
LLDDGHGDVLVKLPHEIFEASDVFRSPTFVDDPWAEDELDGTSIPIVLDAGDLMRIPLVPHGGLDRFVCRTPLDPSGNVVELKDDFHEYPFLCIGKFIIYYIIMCGVWK